MKAIIWKMWEIRIGKYYMQGLIRNVCLLKVLQCCLYFLFKYHKSLSLHTKDCFPSKTHNKYSALDDWTSKSILFLFFVHFLFIFFLLPLSQLSLIGELWNTYRENFWCQFMTVCFKQKKIHISLLFSLPFFCLACSIIAWILVGILLPFRHDIELRKFHMTVCMKIGHCLICCLLFVYQIACI